MGLRAQIQRLKPLLEHGLFLHAHWLPRLDLKGVERALNVSLLTVQAHRARVALVLVGRMRRWVRDHAVHADVPRRSELIIAIVVAMVSGSLAVELTVWHVSGGRRLAEGVRPLDRWQHLVGYDLVANVALIRDARQLRYRAIVAIGDLARPVDVVDIARILAATATATPCTRLVLVVDLAVGGAIALHVECVPAAD